MNTLSQKKKDQGLNVLDLLFYLSSKWKWFIASVLLFTGLAWIKYASDPLIYFRSATVIIKDPTNKTSAASGLDRYDNVINKVNVANELLQFRSKRLMREVVSRLNANISYLVKDGLRYNELYKQSPVVVTLFDVTPESAFSFHLTPLNDTHVQLSKFNDSDETVMSVKMNDTVKVGSVRMLFSPTNYYKHTCIGLPIKVTKLPLDAVVARYQGGIGIRQAENESSIITLSLKDMSPTRAEDVLNTLITVYNELALKDKNRVAVNTANFINERLDIISGELGEVESDLEIFKRSNRMIDIETSANTYFSESQKYNSSVLELETQLRIALNMKEYLTDPVKEVDLIPSNTGISEGSIEAQINQYNALKLRRDQLIVDSSDSNPIVEELNNSLRSLKQNIIRAVDNLVLSLEVKRKDAIRHEQTAQSKVASIPVKERQLLSIERQQKIKESLYMFLLNRREENAISQAMADNNAYVMDSAEGGAMPISPDKTRILILGFTLGIGLPVAVFLAIMFMDTRVHSRKDIKDMVDIPYLGEVPLRKNAIKRRLKLSEITEVVKGKDAVAESFRQLRTNIAFMANKKNAAQVITFTSINESAGKTFVSTNLAMSFVCVKKRVLLVDLDIRKGTLSHAFHLPKKGISNYLADETVTLDEIVCHYDGLDIIPAGSIPPNPAELLMDRRLDQLLGILRSTYDYIILDNVPVGMVADATIVNRLADLTIFVIRAGKLDRRQLPDIEQMYEEKTLCNMAMVLNGVDFRHCYGYGYGYGYGHYGYGSNSYYGNHDEKKVNKTEES